MATKATTYNKDNSKEKLRQIPVHNTIERKHDTKHILLFTRCSR